MRNKKISVICAVIALAGIVLLTFGYSNYSKKQANISSVYTEMSKELRVLESEKTAEKKAIKEIDDNIETAADIHSTVSLIFRGASEKIYTEIFPVMEERGLKGVVSISQNTLPGGEGLIKKAHLNALVEAGWVIISEWTEGDGENGITSVETWAKADGYSLNQTVLVPQAAYTTTLETAITDSGYTTIIKNLEVGGENAVYLDKISDVWNVGAMGYLGNSRNSVITSTTENNGHIIFTIGFEKEFELYNPEKFTAMLNYLSSYDNELEIMDTISAKTYRKDADIRYAEAISEAEEKKAEHLKNIDEIEKKIADVYKKYKA